MRTQPPKVPGARRSPLRRKVRVSPARGSDLGTLVAQRQAMFEAIGGFLPEDFEGHNRVYRRWLSQRLRSGHAYAVIAWEGERPIGGGVVWLREEQPRPRAPQLTLPYILSIYVEPGARGRGVATAITARLVEWSKRKGFTRIVLHASRFGRGVYRRLGFERTWEMRLGGTYRRRPGDPGYRRGTTARRSRPRPPSS